MWPSYSGEYTTMWRNHETKQIKLDVRENMTSYYEVSLYLINHGALGISLKMFIN